MENQLQVFSNEKFGDVRTIIIDDEPWFVGKDVAKILGYKETANMRKLIEKEDFTEINPQTLDIAGFVQFGISPLEPNPNVKRMLLINESGLYQAIFRSALPEAKSFKRWVTSEILPSIRKHGGYFAGQENMSEIELLSRAVLVANSMIEEKQKTIDTQKQQISELEPSAAYCDKILKTKNAVPTSVIAKDFGWSPQRLNNYLQEKHVQYKVGETWVLYQEHCDKGYTKSFTFTYRTWAGDEESVVQTKWTQAGRKFIYELLKADGILPVIEAVV